MSVWRAAGNPVMKSSPDTCYWNVLRFGTSALLRLCPTRLGQKLMSDPGDGLAAGASAEPSIFCINLINLCYQRIHIIKIHGFISFRINSSQIK